MTSSYVRQAHFSCIQCMSSDDDLDPLHLRSWSTLRTLQLKVAISKALTIGLVCRKSCRLWVPSDILVIVGFLDASFLLESSGLEDGTSVPDSNRRFNQWVM